MVSLETEANRRDKKDGQMCLIEFLMEALLQTYFYLSIDSLIPAPRSPCQNDMRNNYLHPVGVGEVITVGL